MELPNELVKIWRRVREGLLIRNSQLGRSPQATAVRDVGLKYYVAMQLNINGIKQVGKYVNAKLTLISTAKFIPNW